MRLFWYSATPNGFIRISGYFVLVSIIVKIRRSEDGQGSPWPLKVKGKFSYNYTGSDAINTWKDQHKCKVKETIRVSVPAGEFDTYKVVCSDKWNTRTWWVSPELGHSVAFKRKHKSDNARSYMMELVKTVRP